MNSLTGLYITLHVTFYAVTQQFQALHEGAQGKEEDQLEVKFRAWKCEQAAQEDVSVAEAVLGDRAASFPRRSCPGAALQSWVQKLHWPGK